jgi:hypothetical protein
VLIINGHSALGNHLISRLSIKTAPEVPDRSIPVRNEFCECSSLGSIDEVDRLTPVNERA